jgi:hypothetical protein
MGIQQTFHFICDECEGGTIAVSETYSILPGWPCLEYEIPKGWQIVLGVLICDRHKIEIKDNV